jgi:hypothetical protein
VALNDYPIDVRVDYPPSSSRGWAALTIIWVKFLALIPHFFVLVFLSIAQLIVAFVAQIVVAIKGEYPAGMFDFVAGVLRWSTRVGAFLLSITDRYPPFTLEPDPAYPVDVVLERPARSNRLYALFTVIVQVGLFVAAIAFVAYLIHHGSSTTFDNNGNVGSARFNFGSPPGGSGLLLREIAALPHLIVLAVLGIAALVIWIVVQWVILFRAVYPRGMFDFTAGVIRWQTRVSGYTLGLSDRYPPFTFESSTGQTASGPAPAVWGATAVPGAAPATWGATAVPGPAPASAPPAWYADPAGRHTHRYWDGAQWTPHVADGGQTSYDPLEGPGAPGAV